MGDEVLFVRSKESKDDETSQNESDAWDDTALIEAYDNAVSLAKEEVKRRMGLSDMEVSPNPSDIASAEPSKHRRATGKANRSSKKGNWVVGDACRCVFAEDGISYEACIIQINHAVGTCIVKYVGYDNEEVVDLNSLQYSHGHAARLRQAGEAEDAKPQAQDAFEDNHFDNQKKQTNPDRKFRRQSKSPQHKMDRNSYSHSYNNPRQGARQETSSPYFPLHHTMGVPPMMVPPPPPIHLMSSSSMSDGDDDSEALSSMLMSWYMSGFHTGYYQGVKQNTQSHHACSKCNCKNKH